MKNLFTLICITCFIGVQTLSAQDNSNDTKNHPIFDRAEDQVKSTDTIPEYRSKVNKLKLTGTIYQSDGVTPAKDVILYIEQPDENGDFDLRKTAADGRYVFHRTWVKTDENGRYTLYTFVPGNDRRYNRLQEIYPVVKAPSVDAYEIETFLFDEDPLLTKLCRKRIAKKSDTSRILTPKADDSGLLVANRDIVLKSSGANTNTTKVSK